MTKQATHVVPLDGVSIHILAAENGGFCAFTNSAHMLSSQQPPERYVSVTGAAFSTAEECGAWVLSVLKAVTHKKFGAKTP